MLEKMEKHALLSEKLIHQHTLALEQHGSPPVCDVDYRCGKWEFYGRNELYFQSL
jgi:hypothetical protein